MAKTQLAPHASKPAKLPRLPKKAKIHKRPLNHPAIASHRAGAHLQKVVYISASSPFISATKRVRKYLSEIDKRAMGKIDLLKPGNDREKVQKTANGVKGRGEEVLVKGTGKAIEKTLQIALYFQGQNDCALSLRTGSVGAVDDVVVKEGEADDEGEDIPETRIRRTSMLEVGISLR